MKKVVIIQGYFDTTKNNEFISKDTSFEVSDERADVLVKAGVAKLEDKEDKKDNKKDEKKK